MGKKIIFIGATGFGKYCAEGRSALLDAGYELIENDKNRPYTEEELKEVLDMTILIPQQRKDTGYRRQTVRE